MKGIDYLEEKLIWFVFRIDRPVRIVPGGQDERERVGAGRKERERIRRTVLREMKLLLLRRETH